MDVEDSLKEQVKLLKSSFTGDVIAAILKENPEFKKYMDFQESQEGTESESVKNVSDAVNLEINKDQEKTKETFKNQDKTKETFKNQDKTNDTIKDQENSNDKFTSNKAKIPAKLNGITIQKVNKNVQASSSNPDIVDLTSEKDTDYTFANKRKIVITKSEKAKRYISARSWYDGSAYECVKCNLVLFQYRAFRPHLQKHHELSQEKITELATKAKIERDSKKYKCLICQECVFHDKNDIMFHLEKNHKMSVKNYEEDYKVNKESVPEGKEKVNEENKSKPFNLSSRLSSKIGISITKSSSKTQEFVERKPNVADKPNMNAKDAEKSKSKENESKVSDASEMHGHLNRETIKENRETMDENPKQKSDRASSLDSDENKVKEEISSTEELKRRFREKLKEKKERESQNSKRKHSEDEVPNKGEDIETTNKKMKYEDLMKTNKIGDVNRNSGNKFKSEKIATERDEAKKSSDKEINYVVALVKGHNSDSEDKLPKEKSAKKENVKDEKEGQNSAKNTKSSSSQSKSTKTDSSQDTKGKTSQKPFQKYGQSFKQTINYSDIFNEPHFESTRSWYDGVEYQCNFCNTIFFEIVNFRSHIRKSHEIHKEILNDMADDAKQARENSEYYCLICEARVMYTKDDIRIHLKAKHSLSLKQYEDIDFNDDAKIETLKKADDSTSSSDTKSDQPTKLAEKKWFDERAIICSFCDNEFSKVDTYLDHIGKTHPEKKDSVTKKSVQTSQQYKCKMQSCSSRIKRHKKNISDHLRKVHSLALEDYENLHEKVVTDKEESSENPSVSFESIFESLDPNSHQIQGDNNEMNYGYDQEYDYECDYDMEDTYEFDEDYFSKKYFCPIQDCDQIMYQEDIESGTALDHFKLEHYLSVEDIADNLAHLEDIIDNNDETAERINYNCPVKDCKFTIHQSMANTSALSMHLGFQHAMSRDEVLLNIFYFANIVKRDLFKEEELKDCMEEEEIMKNDINHNKILTQTVVERKRFMRGIEMTRKENVFHCKVCKSDGMTEGAADLHLKIHHDVSPEQIKINLGLIVV